ncbi:fibronectin type III domain-containing protein [uncultured Lacinutrix sp.]|uniref:fibronectin type III domain-containing protein n=1 Tax=uncultured Lacinutrix sp. TaxID=574032 RepID=UPI002633A457|nr:fibronectin type III domain-containing protein [uncultured Lacinutrix sp.]
MKKITLFLMVAMISAISWAQCTTGVAYQGAALVNDGSLEQQSNCNYTGEYSNTTNVIDGNTYTFSSAVATDFLTVTSSDGTVTYGFGVTPLTLAIDTSGDLNDQALRVYYHEDAACGSANNCRATSVRNDTAAANSCFDPTGLTAANLQETTTDLSWTSGGPTDVDYNVTVFASGADPMVDTPVFTANNVAGTMVQATGLVSNTPYDAYVIANCSGATAQSMLVGPTSFTTTTACPDPTALTASNITFNSADLSWTQTGSVMSWDIELVDITAMGAATGTATATGVTNPYTLMSLNPSNDYEFYVQADCSATWVGPFAFSTPAAPPANDDFANATAITCGTTYTGNTSSATLDEDYAGEPAGGADFDAPNVWFSYTGSGSPEDVTLDLCGSDYDTGIMVFTGTTGALTQVAENEDAAVCGAAAPESYRSFLTFPSDGTTTYYITVEGWNVGSVGNYNLVTSCVAATMPPPNDLCANAEALTLGSTAMGTTVGATKEAADANPTCESNLATIVDVWYTFDATITGQVDITTTITGTSDQANVAVYTDCTLATQLACSDANGGESINVNGLTDGTTYYVRVWGDGIAARTEGTFDITVAESTLSTPDFDNNSLFSYYPNPVKNTLTLNAQKEISNVTVYNMIGQTIHRAAPNAVSNVVDMSNMQAGAYFVQVTVGDAVETVKVIKK